MNKLNLEQFVRIALQTPDMKEYEEYMAIDASSVVIPAHVDRKIKRNIRRKIEGKKPISAKKITARILLVALIAMSVMFVTIMVYGETREGVIRAFIEWKENFIAIHYSDKNESTSAIPAKNADKPTDTEAPTEDNTKEKPSTIEEIRKPSYMPPDIIEGPITSNQSLYVIEYYTLEDVLAYTFEQHVWTDGNKFFDNKGAIIEEIVISEGYIGTVVTYEEKSDGYLVWNDGEYIYVISSRLIPKEEMIIIANSVTATVNTVE